MTIKTTAAFATILCATVAAAQPPAAPPPVALVLSNQFDQTADLADARGAVVVLVYGDRRATDACKALGEQLHVFWHPAAKGRPPAEAHAAPVVGLAGLRPGQPSPDVRVVPVACCGKVPGPVRAVIRAQIAKGAPEVPVWLDFADTMKTSFGQTPGMPNVVVIDAAGRLRATVNGAPDQAALDGLVKTVQVLRFEAAK